jgi:sugar porter (SP) family MFS transporter
MLGLLGAIYQIGSVASIAIVPWFADHLGRKMPIIIGCVIMIVGAVMQGAGSTLGVFIGGRFLMGFGNSFSQLASPTLLTEICHPQHRARLTTVYNCLWNVGALFVSWLSFGTNYLGNEWSWRIPALLQAFPSLIQLSFIWWVPESPRYLIAKDKHEQALEILGRYHANGNINHPTVQFEYREIKETLALELEAKKQSSYLDFVKTKGNRYRLAVLISLGVFSQWSGNAIISNYSSKLYDSAGVTDSTAKLGLSAGQTTLALIVSISMAMFVDKLGRRPTFLVSTGGMLTTFIFWTLSTGLYEDKGAEGGRYAMIVFIWIFGIFYSLAWSGLLVGYAIEVLPYTLRAKGLMIMNLSVQVALTLNTYANPVGFDAFEPHTWKLYLIYTVSRQFTTKPPNLQNNNNITSADSFFPPHHSAGSPPSSSSSTSCTSRPRAPPSRSSPRSSTATMPPSRNWTSSRSRRRPPSSLTRSTSRASPKSVVWQSISTYLPTYIHTHIHDVMIPFFRMGRGKGVLRTFLSNFKINGQSFIPPPPS